MRAPAASLFPFAEAATYSNWTVAIMGIDFERSIDSREDFRRMYSSEQERTLPPLNALHRAIPPTLVPPSLIPPFKSLFTGWDSALNKVGR